VHRILPATALLLLLSSPVAFAGLVNGSFEPVVGPTAPAGIHGLLIPGWQARGVVAWRAATADGFVAPSGDWLVEFPDRPGRAASVRQTFTTVPGELYEVMFWLGSRAGETGPGVASVRVDVAGTSETEAIDNDSSELLWQPHVVSFLARGTSTTLAFHAVGAGSAYLDGVAVQPAPLVPAPEPATH
jgi:hypothetical protein